MKRIELITSILLVPIDYLALLFAASLAYRIRLWDLVAAIRPVIFNIEANTYAHSVAVIALIWLIIFAFFGLYRRRVTDTWLDEIGRVVMACSVGLIVIAVVIFLRGELFASRFIVLVTWFLAIVIVSFFRLLVRMAQRLSFRYGYGAHRVVVVGNSAVVNEVSERLALAPELGYVVAATFSCGKEGQTQLRSFLETHHVDEVLLVDTQASRADRQQVLEIAEFYHVLFRYAPDLLHASVGVPRFELEIGLPLIEVPETTLVGWGKVMKRLVDLVGTLFLLVVFSPIFLLISVLQLLDTGRPIFFGAARVSRHREFIMYKFRSMQLRYCIGEKYGGEEAEVYYQKLIAEQSDRRGPIPKIIRDPRVTRIGHWLRRTSLDELPQLLNVLYGEMSLVGPRPHFPREVARYEQHHRKVLAVKPGLTGLAQVSGRSDLDFEEEVRLDRYYIEHWSLLLDLRILLRTIPAVFRNRKAL